MSDTEVESLNTMSPLTFPEILENIKDCATESVENEDYIGFSTILDLYLHDWSSYNVEERIQLMELLYDVLEKNKTLLAEVAWDLPPLLLPFIDCDWPVRFSLRENIQVVSLWKVFNLLAEYGNPKELLLTCCELLSNLKEPEVESKIEKSQIERIEQSLDDSYKSQFDDLDGLVVSYLSSKETHAIFVKFHSLFQCIKFCLQRIKTIYPSKFLGMVVSSILNFFNGCDSITSGLPVQRTLYLFIRDYIPPDIPDSAFEENSEEDLAKVFEDECYLQRKLTRLLFDSLVEKLTFHHYNSMIGKLLPKLTDIDFSRARYYYELVNRLLSLALSLDIDAPRQLAVEIKAACSLFDENMETINSSEDIVKLVVLSYNSSSFRSKTPASLPISLSSLCFLYTYSKYVENWPINIPNDITFLDMIKAQLKMFIPYIVDSKLTNYTMVGYFMILTILKIEHEKIVASKTEISDKKVRLIIVTYLQNISSIISNSNVKILHQLYTRFMRKFLQHLPEEFSYFYISDSLRNCPFDDIILSLLQIYKNLILVSKFDDEKLTADLKNLSIDAKNGDSLPPPLPKRTSIVNTSFIDFNKTRQAEFIELVSHWIKDTFDSNEPNHINILKSNRLLSSLNLINSIKFQETKSIVKMLKEISDSIKTVESTINDETDENISVVVNLFKFAVNNANKIYS